MTTNATLQQPEPQTVEDALQQAIALHQAGRLEDAVRSYLAILQTRPNHPEANFNLGVLAVETRHFAAALPYFNAALDADPARGQFWLGYIEALFQAGQQDDARQVLTLARQQGLQGNDVDALAARLDSAPPTQQSTTGHPRASREAAPVASNKKSVRHRKKQPDPRELDSLFTAFRDGRYAEVASLARTMTEQFPQHEFGWKTLGVVYMQMGRYTDALAPMKKAAALSPNDVETHYNLGVTLQGLGRLQEAEASYRKALRINPHYVDALCNLGVALHNLGHLEDAEKNLQKAVRIKPDYAEAHNNLGSTLKELGRLDEAEASCRQALQLQPHNAAAHINLGNVLQALGRLDEAESSYRQALEISPDSAGTHRNLGNVLREKNCLAEAEASFGRALRINPDDAGAHNNLGITLQGLGRLDEADAHFQIALHINPDDARTHDNRGNLLCYLGRLNEAESSYRKALQIAPGEAAMHVNLGKVLMHLSRREEAEASFRRALEISPHDIEIHNHLGRALQDQGRLEEAETCFRSILRTHPDNAGAITNLGHVLLSLGRSDETEACFRKALRINPDHAPLHSNLLYFLLLSSTADGESVFSEHAGFGEQFEPCLRPHWPEHTQSRDPERCLQIGFVSADLYNHAVASFVEPVLAHLSGFPQYSLHAYYNNSINDEVTRRLRSNFAHWHPVSGMPDAELAEKIRADGIDILIDLSGHTAHNRLLAFARKPAPVQASWIGYPGTTGLRAVDYYFADRFLLPPGQFDDQFTEKIVRLPANAPFLPYEHAPPVNALPALSNGHVTFGSFNRPDKLSREVIALWSQLLRALPDARMLLGAMPEEGQYDTLIEWFAEEGIARDRLDFHPRSSMETYLRLHQQVDICLDTFPYNGGTTTHHALWMGVPTITLAGQSMPGRVGTAILSRVGLQDFAVECAEDFVAQGVYWADNLSSLAELRTGLRDHLARSPLRKPELLAAGLNDALRTMWRRWCAGLPAETFEVPWQDMDSPTGNTHMTAPLNKPSTINVTRPLLPPLEEFIPYLEKIWESKWLTNNGPFHEQFERALCDYLGVKHISLFANGTLALVTALQALRVTGEVITTPYSFVATAHSLLWNGIKPVFVDVDPITLNLDPDKIEAAITPQTTAIMPVHCYGRPCDVVRIQEIADNYRLKVIYDAAHAFGVQCQGESVLNHGDLSVLSFHATKVFNTFEGGAIVCQDAKTKRHIDHLKNFGFVDEVTVVASGINGKMSEVNAAFGMLQLKGIDEALRQRQAIDARYRAGLAGVDGIHCLGTAGEESRNYSYFPIMVRPGYPLSRDALYQKLRDNGVHARRYFYPLISDFPMYRGMPSAVHANLPVAGKAAEQVICLPIYPGLAGEQIDFVIGLIAS